MLKQTNLPNNLQQFYDIYNNIKNISVLCIYLHSHEHAFLVGKSYSYIECSSSGFVPMGQFVPRSVSFKLVT